MGLFSSKPQRAPTAHACSREVQCEQILMDTRFVNINRVLGKSRWLYGPRRSAPLVNCTHRAQGSSNPNLFILHKADPNESDEYTTAFSRETQFLIIETEDQVKQILSCLYESAAQYTVNLLYCNIFLYSLLGTYHEGNLTYLPMSFVSCMWNWLHAFLAELSRSNNAIHGIRILDDHDQRCYIAVNPIGLFYGTNNESENKASWVDVARKDTDERDGDDITMVDDGADTSEIDESRSDQK